MSFTIHLYIDESYQLDFTNVATDLGNLGEKEKDDTRLQILGSAASSQTMVESARQESTMCEATEDLDFVAHDLDSEFGDSSGSEIVDDWATATATATEPDLLMF